MEIGDRLVVTDSVAGEFLVAQDQNGTYWAIEPEYLAGPEPENGNVTGLLPGTRSR